MPSAATRASSAGMLTCSSLESKVKSSSLPSAFKVMPSAASSRGSSASGWASCRLSCFLPSLLISADFSAATISLPLLITPTRSAISSASSM